jgi:tRNA nucleotidyltransferase (CCA-adding enzyme)
MSAPPAQGTEVIRRLRELPGGPEVLELASGREDVELVGGAVRDLLLGITPREIDLVLDGAEASFPDAAILFARDLSALLRGEGREPRVSVHERFGTAAVRWHRGAVDIASRRTEHYPAPGALPEVSPGTPEEDLERRDFTVNAIAIRLGNDALGEMRAADHALGDLTAGRLRVLHDASFQEDPTRLLRLCRYAARLGFRVETHTATLASEAIKRGVLATVSAARVGAELRLALREADLPSALGQLQARGVLAALEPPMRFDPSTLTEALSLLPGDGRPDLLALGCLLMSRPRIERDEVEGLPEAREALVAALERFEHPASERRAVLDTALRAAPLRGEIALADMPSALWELLCEIPVEAVSLAGALAKLDGDLKSCAKVEDWLARLRHVRLQISGEDLLAAGLSSGPEIGRRLREALRMRLDDAIAEGREAELSAALGR